jgi:hypothetical protein
MTTPLYGLDKDIGTKCNTADKLASKYDQNAEKEARDWIEQVIGEQFPSEDFQGSLKDGIILCKFLV